MAGKKGQKSPGNPLKKLRKLWGKFWYFFWEEDTLLSWTVNIVVAFILIKWVIYPGLGIILQTSHPVVAVISTSMEHNAGFEEWWSGQEEWYSNNGITREQFLDYRFKNGFNRGDIMLLSGIKGGEAEVGDVIVYNSYVRKEPIIHRLVKIEEKRGSYYYTTKGDRNTRSYQFEQDISPDKVIGTAFFRMPYLGWIKISFVCIIDSVTGKDNLINCMRRM